MAAIGGQVQGISLDSFLQMVQMEKTTCTLRVLCEEDVGFLFISKGVLIAAEIGALSGPTAASEIISWENSIIEIDKTCERSKDEIKQPLMNVLMEGLRLRDERTASGGALKMMDTQSFGAPSASKPPSVPAPSAPLPDTGPPPKVPIETAASPAPQKPGFSFHKPKKKKVSLVRILVILAVAVAAGVGAYLSVGISGAERQSRELQSKLLQATTLAEKVNLLEAYLETRPTEKYETVATRLLTSFKGALDAEILAAVKATAKTLSDNGDLKSAAAEYAGYLEAHSKSSVRGIAEKEMAELTARMADQAFEALGRDTPAMGPERLDRYDEFLTAFPNSEHEAAVRELIGRMQNEYFDYFETQVAVATHAENWQRCQGLVNRFTRLYPDHPKSLVLKKLLPIFEKNQKQKTDFEQLMATAREKGADYTAAAGVLSSYLSAFPDTYLRDRIKAQIDRYRRMSEEIRIAELTKTTSTTVNAAGKRFKADPAGTVLDTRTNLMWSLLDSQDLLKDCIDYNGAKTFVAGLNIAGHEDWRLPKPEELEAIYKEAPAFPSAQETWYWSTQFYRQFAGQWVFMVNAVSTAPHRSQPPMQKDSRDCGTVRAVRRP